MKKELTLALGTILADLLLSGYAWTSGLDSILSNVCVAGGLILSVIGFISFVLILKRKPGADQKVKSNERSRPGSRSR